MGIKCKICGEETNYDIYLFPRYHLKKVHNMGMKEYYDTFLKKEGEGFCVECGKPTNIRRFTDGYRKFCSSKCINANREVRKKMDLAISKRTDEDKKNTNKKRIETNKNRFGVSHFSQLDEVKIQKRKKMIDREFKKYEKMLPENLVIKNIKVNVIDVYCVKCDKEMTIQKQMVNKRYKKGELICIKCNPFKIGCDSRQHLEIIEFIKKNYPKEVIKNDRILLNGKELDIYIPDLKLAIEFNGLYWHNELHKDKNYHLEKTELCEEIGIKLIHIYEDEWLYKREIVQSRILSLLGRTSRFYARECYVEEIDNKTSKEFLKKYHIQGEINSKYSLALIYKHPLMISEEIISVMTFGNSRFEKNKLEMLRFCTKNGYTAIGGASKLFKYFLRNYDVQEVISYADRSWSNGNLYEKLGFELIKKINPNYSYVIGDNRCNRYKFRKSNLIKEGFDKNKTEKEIMFDRDIYRIYDSGSLKYEYKL